MKNLYTVDEIAAVIRELGLDAESFPTILTATPESTPVPTGLLGRSQCLAMDRFISGYEHAYRCGCGETQCAGQTTGTEITGPRHSPQ